MKVFKCSDQIIKTKEHDHKAYFGQRIRELVNTIKRDEVMIVKRIGYDAEQNNFEQERPVERTSLLQQQTSPVRVSLIGIVNFEYRFVIIII